jgi:hypothetical protein
MQAFQWAMLGSNPPGSQTANSSNDPTNQEARLKPRETIQAESFRVGDR